MIQRIFIPGSEWLYFKLYTGHKSADRLLVDVIGPMVTRLLKSGQIVDFFFIRYSDPKPHVRLRLHIVVPEYYAPVFQTVFSAFGSCIESGLLSDVVCATYRRELERYGLRTMEAAERLFGVDSRAVIELLNRLQEAEDPEQDRWLLSLKLLDDMLEMFGYDMVAKSRLMEQVSRGFRQEFGCDKQPYSKQLDDKYRLYRALIEEVLEKNPESKDTAYSTVCLERCMEMMPVVNEICQRGDNGKGEVLLDNLLESYMHMTMNRLFRSKNRQFEMVVYHFLAKYYKSAMARKKYNRP